MMVKSILILLASSALQGLQLILSTMVSDRTGMRLSHIYTMNYYGDMMCYCRKTVNLNDISQFFVKSCMKTFYAFCRKPQMSVCLTECWCFNRLMKPFMSRMSCVKRFEMLFVYLVTPELQQVESLWFWSWSFVGLHYSGWANPRHFHRKLLNVCHHYARCWHSWFDS